MSKEKFKNFYDRYWNIRSKVSFKYRYNIFLSWIDEGSKVLDVGSGDAYLAKLLSERKKCDVTCMDISEVAVRRAQEAGMKAFVGSAEEKLPFEDDSFDAVVATEVIEHVAFSEEAIMEMARVSRKYILLSIPNVAYIRYRLNLLTGKFPRQWAISPVEHLRYWSVTDFKHTISGLGLRVIEIKAGSGRRYLRDIWPNMFAEQVCFRIVKK